jgi:hypothetical protein
MTWVTSGEEAVGSPIRKSGVADGAEGGVASEEEAGSPGRLWVCPTQRGQDMATG